MALSGGHWSTLAEVKKLTQATLIPGSVEEDIKRGNPFEILPMAQANHTGSSIKWLREATTAEDSVADASIGQQTVWTEDVTYDEVERELRICYLQRKLDKYVPSIYQTFNNYEEIVLQDMLRSVKKKLGKKIVYDDYTYDVSAKQMDGLHAIAAESFGEAWDIDMGEAALSLDTWRQLKDSMKHGVDFWLVPFWVARRLSAQAQEKGFAGLATATAGTMGTLTWGTNELGQRVGYWDNVPIIPTDFLVAEENDTGKGTDARAVYATGTRQYSIFGIKRGNGGLGEADPGLKLAFGKTEEDGQFVNLEYFSKLENYIGKGMRIEAYTQLLAGSAMSVGRIFDITDAAILV